MSKPIYKPSRTYVVDTLTSCYLTRGNEPLQHDEATFAYDELNEQLKELIGGDFDLTQYQLTVISLLDNNAEGDILKAEVKCFGLTDQQYADNFNQWPPYFRGVDIKKTWGTQVAGHPGSIIWYPVQGCTCCSNCHEVEPPQYDFQGLVDYLNQLATAPATSGKKTVIYFHCEHGHDRTSAVHAAYLIKYKGMDLEAAKDEAKKFSHDWEDNYEQLVNWYYSVYTSTDCIDC